MGVSQSSSAASLLVQPLPAKASAPRSSAAPSTGGTASVVRVEGFDAIRVVAAFAVVMFHAIKVGDGFVARGGVPAFLMIAMSIPAMKRDPRPFKSYAKHRAFRIGVPWLFWSAFYLAAALVWYRLGGNFPDWTIHWIFLGPKIHLWFFPYVLVAGLGIWWVLAALRNSPPRAAALKVATIGFALLVVHAFTVNMTIPSPYAEWLRGSPAVFLGTAFGLSCRISDERARRNTILTIASCAMILELAALAIGSPLTTLNYVPGTILIPAALLYPFRPPRWVRSIAAVSMGVYATHPFVLMILRTVLRSQVPPLWYYVPGGFAGAVLLSKAIKRTSLGKYIV